jgi:ribulose 1,5-bisphosphate synthetase/thiazole synthase
MDSIKFEGLGTDTGTFSNVDVLVIGAGPTGLGAAKRLNQIVCDSAPRTRCATEDSDH